MNTFYNQSARDDFNRALRKGFWRKVYASLRGESTELLPYDEIRRAFPMLGQRYIGLQTVPIDHIIGSVGRYRDFDRAFTPTQTRTASRWMNIDLAHYQDVPLPPVELYKIGETYFVKDGNHRVSVARERGQSDIDAYVIEIDIPISLTPDVDPGELKLKKEYAAFLEKTSFSNLRPEANFEITLSGEYERLLEHISGHRWYLGEKHHEEVPYSDAVISWYDNVYRPLVEIIKDQGLLSSFPGRTETDLYLWVSEYQWLLKEAYQGNETIQEAARKLAKQHKKAPTKKVVSQLQRARWIDQYILQQEREDFDKTTHLSQTRPESRIEITLPGKYERLIEHIRVHRWFLGEENQEEISFEAAAASWYDQVYFPLIEIIRQQNILEKFPNRTEADLYLWIIDHRARLASELGWDIAPETVATDLADRQKKNAASVLGEIGEKIKDAVTPDPLESGPHPGWWRETRLTNRVAGVMFAELLVAIGNHENDWRALDQSISIAKKSQTRIHGLYVVPEIGMIESAITKARISEFERRCQAVDISAKIAIEVGNPARKISERARWVDLVVLPFNHPPPEQGFSRLSSGFRTILRRAGRPLLTVPGEISDLNRILLAYNGSPKSDEGLYIAKRLAAEWHAELVVLTVDEEDGPEISDLHAQKYFEKHQIKATFVRTKGHAPRVILEKAEEHHINLLIMGGYGSNPIKEVFLGSTVDKVLGAFKFPVLIST